MLLDAKANFLLRKPNVLDVMDEISYVWWPQPMF